MRQDEICLLFNMNPDTLPDHVASCFLDVVYPEEKEGDLVEEIGRLDYGMDMRTQYNEFMFMWRKDGKKVFSLAIKRDDEEKIRAGFAALGPKFEVSFNDGAVPDFTIVHRHKPEPQP